MPTPILLFPGIMGTRLYFSASDHYWDPDDKFRMLFWLPVWPRTDDDNRLNLHGSQPADPIVEEDDGHGIDTDRMNRGWSTVVWTSYGDMLNTLERHFGPGSAYAVGYDWRQDIGALGTYACAKIRAAAAQSGVAKVKVVTHSMGGLVVRAALSFDPTIQDQIERVVHICMPAAGAVVMYRRMFTGMHQGYDGGSGLGNWAYRFLLGDSPSAFRGNLSGMPGAVELIPTAFLRPDPAEMPVPPYAWNSLISTTDPSAFTAAYAGAACPPGLVPAAGLQPAVKRDLSARTTDVISFMAAMGDPAIPRHPNTWHICGINQPTETAVDFDAAGTAIPTSTKTSDGPGMGGDGTVPIRSAQCLGVPDSQFITIPAEHGSACVNTAVQTRLLTIL